MEARQLDLARRSISAVFFVNGAVLGSWAPHIPAVRDRLNLPPNLLGLALLASGVGAVLTMPFAGFLIHRFGSRRLIQLAGLLVCCVLVLVVTSQTLTSLILVLFATGVVNGQLDVSMNAHSVAVQDRYERPMLSAVHGWFSLGGFAGGLGAAAAAYLQASPVAHMGWACSILAGVLFVACRGLLPAEVDAESEGARFVLPKGALLLLGVMTFFAFFAEGALWDWASVYVRVVLQSDYAVSALGFGAFSLGLASARFVGDKFIRRFSHSALVAVGGALSAMGLILAVSIPLHAAALAGFFIAGLGIANIIPVFFKVAGATPGVAAGAGLAMVTTCGYTGLLAGPALIGFVAGGVGLPAALALMAGFSVLIALAGPRLAGSLK